MGGGEVGCWGYENRAVSVTAWSGVSGRIVATW